jgi:hypothetical protein
LRRAVAEAVYNAEWKARVKQLYGSEPEISWFDSPVIVDNQAGGTITKAAWPKSPHPALYVRLWIVIGGCGSSRPRTGDAAWPLIRATANFYTIALWVRRQLAP